MPKVLDDAQVTELCELMGDDLVPLVQAFLRDGHERLQLLEQAWRANDREQLRRQAHSLKGSSSNLGAIALSVACFQLESLTRDGGNTVELSQIESELALVRREFDTLSLELQHRFLPSANNLAR